MNANLISVLLVEDDPGDVLLIKEAFADHKVGNGLSVVSDGVEAMRFGTPVIVPAGSGPAVTHARATGSAAFGDEAELLDAVGALRDATRRAEASDAARRYADERYGDPHALVRRLEGLLSERSPNPGGATGDSVG